jgi:uncharacterized protein (DUF2236 family)
MAEQVVDRFDDRRLSAQEREQLYREGLVWYSRYGVSDRAVPATRADFQDEWDRVCREVLEMNEAVAFVLEMLDRPMRLELPRPLGVLNPVLRRGPVARLLRVPVRISTIGGLPPIVRERFDIPWSRSDQRQLDALELAVRKAWRFVPFSTRWQPRAQDGWKRVRAEARGEPWPAAS